MLSHSSLLWTQLLVESGAEENMVELLTAFIIGAIIGWLARQFVPRFARRRVSRHNRGRDWLATFPAITSACWRWNSCIDYRCYSSCNRGSGDYSEFSQSRQGLLKEAAVKGARSRGTLACSPASPVLSKSKVPGRSSSGQQ